MDARWLDEETTRELIGCGCCCFDFGFGWYRLGDDSGPVDLSHGEGVYGEGGLEGVEARWLEGQEEDVRRGYQRAKGE